MGYSNTSAQKQSTEKGDCFAGTNAQRKMGAVPVLQKVAPEEELQMKSAVVINSDSSSTTKINSTQTGGLGSVTNLKSQTLNQNCPIQMYKIVVKNLKTGETHVEEDTYDLQKDEDFDFELTEVYETQEREKKKGVHKESVKKEIEEERIAKEKRDKEAEIAEQIRMAPIKIREQVLSKYAPFITRGDHNPTSHINHRGQKKSYLTPEGLMPAGTKFIGHDKHLVQDDPGKPESDLISFSGPHPTKHTDYGGTGAKTLKLKEKKLARAIYKKKPDVAHISIHTSGDLKEVPEVKKESKLMAYVGTDDEHQIRVRQKEKDAPQPIPNRFFGDSPSKDYDSDSDSEN